MGRQRSSSVGQQRKNLGQLLRSNAVQRITKRRDVQSRTGSSLLQAFTGGNTSRAKLWQAARTVENDSCSDQWCWVCKGHSTQALRASRRCISELSQSWRISFWRMTGEPAWQTSSSRAAAVLKASCRQEDHRLESVRRRGDSTCCIYPHRAAESLASSNRGHTEPPQTIAKRAGSAGGTGTCRLKTAAMSAGIPSLWTASDEGFHLQVAHFRLQRCSCCVLPDAHSHMAEPRQPQRICPIIGAQGPGRIKSDGLDTMASGIGLCSSFRQGGLMILARRSLLFRVREESGAVADFWTTFVSCRSPHS